MNRNKHITFNELIEVLEKDTDNNFKTTADFLLEAVTDWPTKDLKEPEEIILALKNEIKDQLTYDNLEKYLSSLSLNADAWKIESINSLLEMFDFDRKCIYDKSTDLEQIIDRVTKHYRNKK